MKAGRFQSRQSQLLSLAGLFLGVYAGESLAEDWPRWRGSQYNGVTKEKLVSPEGESVRFKTLWQAEVGVGFSSFSVAKGRLFTMGNADETDTIWCFDAKTGSVLWKHSYPCALDPLYYEGGPGGTPTVSGDVAYTLSKKGHVFALEAGSGKVVWKRDLVAEYGFKLPEWSFAASPYIDGDKVLLNVGDAGIALDKANGKTLWRSGTNTSGYATPVPLEEAGQMLLFRAQAVSAIMVGNGKRLWDVPWQSSRDVNAADPLVKGRQFLISSASGTALYAITDAESEPPQQIWKTRLISYFNPPVRVGEFVYGFDGTTHRPSRLVCFEWETGKERWAESGFGSGGLVVADDVLVICDKGEIILARATPEKFELLGRETVLQGKCWTAPVVSNGMVYARNAAGTVVCIEIIEDK